MQFFGHGNLDWGALAPLAFGLLTVILAVLVLNRFVRARRKPPPDLRLNDPGRIHRLLRETADLNGRFDVSLERAPQRLMACLLTEVTDEALLVEPPATVKPTESLIGQNVDCYLTVGSGEGMLFYSFSSHITGIRKGKRPALLLDPPTVMHPYSRRSALRSDIPEDVTAEARVWDVADSLKLDKAAPEAWNAPCWPPPAMRRDGPCGWTTSPAWACGWATSPYRPTVPSPSATPPWCCSSP
ncbi:hypothetical protein [Desulfohalovibrio reitneri]|uniref:hypothetical protein n=1 Tax=Desulfohalovibrio reitneri TaxID=1307759 RepID=UPI0004A6C068|nr:hypothetical protein [Desulfohalovibrio reitneri]